MTNATLERLRRGREEAARRRQAAEDAQVADFRAWLRSERLAFDRMKRARDTYGMRSSEAHDAEREWMDIIQLIPTMPPDSAFVRVRDAAAA